MNIPPSSSVTRRRFLTQAGLGLVATASLGRLLGAEAAPVAASAPVRRLRLGVIGCGQRGQWIADLFVEHGGYEVVAAADYFQDKVDETAAKHHLAPGRLFTGLQCAEKMIAAGGLDAVAIISPPFFRPTQARAAVEAGLHVYAAKPVAVDAPGALSIRESGELARRKGLVFLVDFQTRTQEFFIEAMRRVHAGLLGDICFGEAMNQVDRLQIKVPPGTPEARLRNWVFDQALSGDIIVEQNVHVLDVMSWAMKETPPLRCTGTGGRRVRVDVGDCWDHFALVYEYPGNVGLTFSSRQFDGHGDPGGFLNRITGSKGILSTAYGGDVLIRGGADVFYRGGKASGLYKTGAVANIKAFHAQVEAKDSANPTLEPSVTSTLVGVLGRLAAYTGRTVTWEEMLHSKPLTPDLSGLRA